MVKGVVEKILDDLENGWKKFLLPSEVLILRSLESSLKLLPLILKPLPTLDQFLLQKEKTNDTNLDNTNLPY